MLFIKYYIIAFILFFIIDMLWLGVIAKDLYARQIGFLLTTDIRWGAALLFYTLYLIGLVIFVILPASRQADWYYATLYGAAFGLICYATYDLTNLATVKNWPVLLTIYDMLWGSFISAVTATLTLLIGTRI